MKMQKHVPADDALWNWMIGEWEGWSESPMGKTEDWMKVEWDLNQKFLVTTVNSTITQPNDDMIKMMAKIQGMPEEAARQMITTPYLGKGYATKSPQSGEIISYWFDSFRGIYKGSETRDGNKISMKMVEINGAITIERTAEKVTDDKIVGRFKNTTPQGVIEGRFEAIRKN